MTQNTNKILMIRPVKFRFNEQTAENNYYQVGLDTYNNQEINAKAQQEFDTFVEKLRAKTIEVIVIDDTADTDTPDSIFPNNWVSFHDDGTVALYPMNAENRRMERRTDIFSILKNTHGLHIHKTLDYTHFENENVFLEGTGSLVLDRTHKIAYACLSERTHPQLVAQWCADFGYTPCTFSAFQTANSQRLPIYHTNVMLSIYDKCAIVCLDSIDNSDEKSKLIHTLTQSGKQIIEITEAQTNQFAGNTLQVQGNNGKTYSIMSQQANEAFTAEQLIQIWSISEIIESNLHTIETCGGGSARCMMAEVFLP
jgi:hypothetical protein